jgi:DNA polymerase III delta subunit
VAPAGFAGGGLFRGAFTFARLIGMPRLPFSEESVPPFGDAPPAILIVGDTPFFVDEAASRARNRLAEGDTEVLQFEDEVPAEVVSDALLNRSLFSARRLVVLDVSALLGTETPASLLVGALEGWEKGGSAGRREAFRHARALLAALDLPRAGDPAENAEAAARRLRKKPEAGTLAEILKELPEEKGGGPAVLKAALRTLIERGENDGTVALLTAVNPPSGVDLLQEIASKGLVLEAAVGKDAEAALRRLASTLAREREVALDPGAVEKLLQRTDRAPTLFAAELEKLLEWAGKGGRVRPADVVANVEDEASEDLYGLFDAIGRRDAGDALARLERLVDGRDVRQGDRPMEKIEEIWPIQLLGMIVGEVRRMLLLRARLEETRTGGVDAGMSYATFQSRVLPRLLAPAAPYGRSPFESARGSAPHPFALYRASQRASRFRPAELARAVARAADVDAALKSSAPVLETLSAYVADLVAGA